MRRLPWRLVLRADRRAMFTVLGVSLGVAFALVSFAVPAGLETRTVSDQGPFARQDAIVSLPGLAPFDPAPLRLANATGVLVVEATLAAGGPVTLAALEGPAAPPVGADEARPAADAPRGDVVVARPAPFRFRGGPPVDEPLLPRSWVLVDAARLRDMAPDLAGGKVTYVVAPALPPVDAARLQERGYEVARAPAVQPFLDASAREVAHDLFLVVASSSVLVVVFAYEFLRSEVRAKRPEIGLWRALGMRADHVLALLVARAVVITMAGYAVGLVVAVAALAAAGAWNGSTLFLAGIRPLEWLALALVFALSGAAGGLVPAHSASRGLVREQMEATA